MSTILDNFYAFKIVSKLTTNFEDTPAFQLGVIDKDGHFLLKNKPLSREQKQAYTFLDKLVFSLKRIINKLGGENKIKSLAAALLLIKENRNYISIDYKNESLLKEYLELIDEQDIQELEQLIEELGAVPANTTAGVAPKDNVMKFTKRVKPKLSK